jgi:hypothetical protein
MYVLERREGKAFNGELHVNNKNKNDFIQIHQFLEHKLLNIQMQRLLVNYTDRAGAASQPNQYHLLWVYSVEWSAHRVPMVHNLCFLQLSRCFFTQLTRKLSSKC